MTLREFMSARRLTIPEMAELAGVSPQSIRHALNGEDPEARGRRGCGKRSARLLSKATGNMVPAATLMGLAPRQPGEVIDLSVFTPARRDALLQVAAILASA